MKKILLVAASVLVVSVHADFTRIDDKDVVVDNTRQKIWQDNEMVTSLKMGWDDAVAHCEKMVFNGHDDWRLPKKKELLGIVDLSRKAVKIDSAFKNTSDFVYWSSSRPKGDLPLAWRVDFDDGKAHWGGKRFMFHVRCVRDADKKQ